MLGGNADDHRVGAQVMEKGIAVGNDLGAAPFDAGTNRPEVFGAAHDLSDWLGAHPVE